MAASFAGAWQPCSARASPTRRLRACSGVACSTMARRPERASFTTGMPASRRCPGTALTSSTVAGAVARSNTCGCKPPPACPMDCSACRRSCTANWACSSCARLSCNRCAGMMPSACNCVSRASLLAVSRAWDCACASSRCQASNSGLSKRATLWPAFTRSPGATSTCCTTPANGALSNSVAWGGSSTCPWSTRPALGCTGAAASVSVRTPAASACAGVQAMSGAPSAAMAKVARKKQESARQSRRAV